MAVVAGPSVRMVGESVCDTSFLKGYNTYVRQSNPDADDDSSTAGATIVSAVCGVVEVTDRVVSVRSLSPRYVAEVGDVVVGRIEDVLPGRWLADVGAFQHASMLLSNVTEPGGMLRRRGRDDELTMRRIFAEGDLFAAEVQRVSPDGFISLHTRSARKYGRLTGEGTAVPVHAALVRRVRQQFHVFPFGVSLVVGVNGVVWVQRTTAESLEAMTGTPALGAATSTSAADGTNANEDDDGAAQQLQQQRGELILEDKLQARLVVARTANCVAVLSREGVAIEAATIAAAVKMTLAKQLKPYEVLRPEHAALIASAGRAARD